MMIKLNRFKNFVIACVLLTTFAGCGESSAEQAIVYESYNCNETLASESFSPSNFYLVYSGYGEQYSGYPLPTIQVDDKIINIGTTTLGEIYEMFMGVSVEEQIRTANANDDGLLSKTPEEIEKQKKKNELKEKEESLLEEEQDSQVEAEGNPVYSFYLKFDGKDSRSYAPIYLMSSDLTSTVTVQIYKYNEPYVELIFNCLFANNLGIKQESDLIVTGINVLGAKPKYADKDGLNIYAKENVHFNGGFSLSGDDLTFQTLPEVFKTWGLSKGDGYSYNSEYYTVVEDENFYYYADLYCYEPGHDTKNDKLRISKTVIRYTIDRETQEIIGAGLWLEEAFNRSDSRYELTLKKPSNIFK